MFCCQKTILRCGGKAGGAGTAVAAVGGRHFGVAAIGGSGVAGLHPFDFSSRLRASRRCGQVLRSADIKAHGGDGRGDLRGGSFGRPVFAGVRGENLARSRSWPAAELSVWRAARSRGGWPAGPVKLRRLTGPGADEAGRIRGGQSCGAELGGGVAKLARWVKLQKGWRGGGRSFEGGAASGHGASPKCRGGMPGRETGGAAQSWRIGRSCFWGGGPGLGAKCPVLAGVTQSWRIARNCLKGFTPFRTSQDR